MLCCLPAMASRKYCRPFFYAGAAFIIAAFLLLICGFIISDFSLQNVFFNSSTIKPLVFKIAGAWASHEGSILLWLALLSLVGCIFVYKGAEFEHIIILAGIELMFLIFIFFTSNPFAGFSFSPTQGMGLNPTLQDIALAIHPPILYLGYVAYAIPFSITCVLLYKTPRHTERHPELVSGSQEALPASHEMLKRVRDDELSSLQIAKKFSHFAIMALTTGVGLGSWWAYRELGWGGFWFFDPVENISLLPWLSGIALYHSFSVIPAEAGIQKNGKDVLASLGPRLREDDTAAKMTPWILSLSILTFLLSILGIFLVRSGIITSVHSFAFSPQHGLYILAIFTILALGSIGLLAFRSVSFPRPLCHSRAGGNPESSIPAQAESMYPRLRGDDTLVQGIILGNFVWLLALVILLVSIIYPIIHYLIYKQSISIEEPYFIRSFIPVTLIAVLLAAVVPAQMVSFRQKPSGVILSSRQGIQKTSSSKNLNKKAFGFYGWIPAFAGMTLTGITLIPALTSYIALFASTLLLLATLYIWLVKGRFFRKKLSSRTVAMLVAHFGFGLLVLSITLNALTKNEVEFIGKAGDTKILGQLTVSLKNIRYEEGENYYRQIAEFWIYDANDNITTILKPENRLYKIENTLSQESDIYSFLTHDLYAVLSQIDGEVIQAKIYYRPMISFIWLSLLLIIGGFFISLINQK